MQIGIRIVTYPPPAWYSYAQYFSGGRDNVGNGGYRHCALIERRPSHSFDLECFIHGGARVGVNESYFAAVNIVTRWRGRGPRRGVC